MGFLDEVDDIKRKAHFDGLSPAIIVGLAVIVVVIAIFAFKGMLSAADGGFVVRKGSAQTEQTEQTASSSSQAAEVYVYVVGAVAKPGVYGLPKSARVKDAIDAAGGFSAEAAASALNLARVVVDGEQITVSVLNAAVEGTAAGAAAEAASSSGTTTGISADDKVNINTAALEQLKTLKGVGDATAQKIIDSREAEGPFKTTEELKRVSGIGDKKYAAIASSITVG